MLTLATPVAVQALVDAVAFGGLVQPLVILALVLLGCLSLVGTFRALQVYVAELLQRRIFVRVVSALGRRLPRVRVDALDDQHAPELVNRSFDVVIVQKAGASLLLDGFTIVLTTLAGLAVSLERAERVALELGQSTLLVVNLREQAAAEAALLTIDAAADHQRALADGHAALGELGPP